MVSDYAIYKVVESLITLLSLFMVYLGIQIALTWRDLNKDSMSAEEIVAHRNVFIRSSVFIFMAGFFLIIHEFLEDLGGRTPSYVTFETLELLALAGLVLFMCEWHRVLRRLRK